MTNAKNAVPIEMLNFAKNKSKSPTMLIAATDMTLAIINFSAYDARPAEGVTVDDNHNVRVSVDELDDLFGSTTSNTR